MLSIEQCALLIWVVSVFMFHIFFLCLNLDPRTFSGIQDPKDQ
jgi:hypothetical protein